MRVVVAHVDAGSDICGPHPVIQQIDERTRLVGHADIFVPNVRECGSDMPVTLNDKLVSWASEIDSETVRQAEKTARLPIVQGHVALMADAHVGIGATVGSVIPTEGAVIPAAVGVDIGCGMIAADTR